MPADSGHSPGQPGSQAALEFYEASYARGEYATVAAPEQHRKWGEVAGFVRRYELEDKHCLEVGCGRGYFQDLVADYTGLDLSAAAGTYLHKPFVQASATALPFGDNEFDAVWTINALEHVPGPEVALGEIRRVLKPGGLLLLSPAWQCRWWAAEGYPERPYSDFGWRGKLIKACIPALNSVAYRALQVVPRRLWRVAQWGLVRRPTDLGYRHLTPNYEHLWMPDGDAVNSMDPFEAILWHVSRGDECLSHPTGWSRFLVRTNWDCFPYPQVNGEPGAPTTGEVP